jgi:hypothetical protein
MKRQLLIALLACGAGMAANAQTTIYRCGSTYSEQPCANGTPVQALRAPDAAAVAASRKESERQAKAADEMQKARLEAEAKPVPVYIPKEKVEEETPKLHKPEVFVARGPAVKKAVKKKKKAA